MHLVKQGNPGIVKNNLKLHKMSINYKKEIKILKFFWKGWGIFRPILELSSLCFNITFLTPE